MKAVTVVIMMLVVGVILLIFYTTMVHYARRRQEEIFFQPECQLVHGPPKGSIHGMIDVPVGLPSHTTPRLAGARAKSESSTEDNKKGSISADGAANAVTASTASTTSTIGTAASTAKVEKEMGSSKKDAVKGAHHNIRFWYLNPYKDRPTILYFHGSTGNIVSNSTPLIDFCRRHRYNFFTIDYRGYGECNCGTFVPSEKSLIEDARAAYTCLATFLCSDDDASHTVDADATDAASKKEGDKQEEEKEKKEKKGKNRDIIVWGVSLGGLPASYVAANAHNFKRPGQQQPQPQPQQQQQQEDRRERIISLVLWSTFADVDAIANGYNRHVRDNHKNVSMLDRFLYLSVSPFLQKMSINNNVARAAKNKIPIVVLHGKKDEVISYDNALKNYATAKHNYPKSLEGFDIHAHLQFIDIHGAHAKPTVSDESWSKLISFLERSPAATAAAAR